MRDLVVQKFGGTSVGSLERIRHVAHWIASTQKEQNNVVVVSAMSGVTNKLVEQAFEMSSNPMPEAYDMLLASGEQASAALVAMALHEIGVPAVPMMSFQAGIETTDLFTKARITGIQTKPILGVLASGAVPVVAGFQGFTTKNGVPTFTTLGRGGSDTSAVAVAVALSAKRCDIYTDVDGVYTADPRVVPNARLISTITFEEMMELASLGAKVLHMRSVELAAKHHMPLRVLNTFNPTQGGTTLLSSSQSIESPVVSSITADSSDALVHVRAASSLLQKPGLLFRPLADAGINVDVIVKTVSDSSGVGTVSFSVPKDEAKKAVQVLAPLAQAEVSKERLSKVSIVGIGMKTHSGVAATMFEVLEKNGIAIHLVTTSEIKVSVLIDEEHKNLAVRALHDAFHLSQPPTASSLMS